jgi:hypothetical protein
MFTGVQGLLSPQNIGKPATTRLLMKPSMVAFEPWLLKPPLLKPTPMLAKPVTASVASQVRASLGSSCSKVLSLSGMLAPPQRPGLIGSTPAPSKAGVDVAGGGAGRHLVVDLALLAVIAQGQRGLDAVGHVVGELAEHRVHVGLELVVHQLLGRVVGPAV